MANSTANTYFTLTLAQWKFYLRHILHFTSTYMDGPTYGVVCCHTCKRHYCDKVC
jgi:hypothetical protein